MAGPPIPEAEELDCRVPSGAIVIGPKELPRVMLQVGQTAAKVRRMAAEFRSQFMDAMREAEIDDIKSDVERLAESAKADNGMDPLAQITAELTQAIDSAEKPAMLPGATTRTTIAGPNNAEPLLNSIAGPCLPEAPEEVGLSFSKAGRLEAAPISVCRFAVRNAAELRVYRPASCGRSGCH